MKLSHRGGAAAGGIALAAASLIASGDFAVADQPAPAASATRVATLQHELDAAESASRDLDARAELAAEAYDGAVLRQQHAEAAAHAAETLSRSADAAQAQARDAVGALAEQTYQDGLPASLAVAGAVLRADGIQDAMIRQNAYRAFASHVSAVLSADTDTARSAADAAAQARTTADAARLATAAVAAASAEAERQAAVERTQLAVLQTRRQRLLAELAAAQRISLAQAARRQDALTEQTAREQAQTETPAPMPPPADPSRARGTPAGAASAIAFARAQLGLPYAWGAAGPRSYDCSGLTMRAWEHGGVPLPHLAADQYARSQPIPYGRLRPGDLVFWSHTGRPQDIFHVALYLGADQMIEAPRPGGVVKVADLFLMGPPSFYARP